MNRLLWLIAPLFLVGCSTGKIVDFLAFNQEINGVIDFIVVFIKLGIYSSIITFPLSIFTSNDEGKGRLIMLGAIICFIWMIIYRDYGFWNMTLLFLPVLLPMIGVVMYILQILIDFIMKLVNYLQKNKK